MNTKQAAEYIAGTLIDSTRVMHPHNDTTILLGVLMRLEDFVFPVNHPVAHNNILEHLR